MEPEALDKDGHAFFGEAADERIEVGPHPARTPSRGSQKGPSSQ